MDTLRSMLVLGFEVYVVVGTDFFSWRKLLLSFHPNLDC